MRYANTMIFYCMPFYSMPKNRTIVKNKLSKFSRKPAPKKITKILNWNENASLNLTDYIKPNEQDTTLINPDTIFR